MVEELDIVIEQRYMSVLILFALVTIHLVGMRNTTCSQTASYTTIGKPVNVFRVYLDSRSWPGRGHFG